VLCRYVPYSIYFFIEKIVNPFKAGSFHRNAGHVLQAQLNTPTHENFAWQEYSNNYPHEKYTLGYAGRPSSNAAFYISTVDNTRNHGPASQGSKTEADACLGKIVMNDENIAIVEKMKRQKGNGNNGFVTDRNNYITINSLKMKK
jgi:hypothetical protein